MVSVPVKHGWLCLHQLDTFADLERLITFYVEQHTWQIDLMDTDGSQSTVAVRIVEATDKKDSSALLRSGRQRSLIRSAAACGSQLR